MSSCPQCQASNADGSVFCTSCGFKMQSGTLQSPVSPAMGTFPPPVQPQPIPVTYVQEPSATPKKKSSLPIILVVIVVLIVAGYFAVKALANSNPSLKLLKGFAEMSSMDKMTMSVSAKVEMGGDIEELLKKAAFDMVIALDTNDMLAEASVDLLYDKKTVFGVMAGVNNEIAYIDPIKLYDEDFMINLPAEYAEGIEPFKIVRKAMKGIKLDVDMKKYAKIISEELDENIEKNGNDVVVTMDVESINDTMKALIEEAIDDKKLMESARKSAITVVKELIKESDNLEDMVDVDELESTLEELEDEDAFEEMYVEGLESMLSSMENAMYMADGESTMTFGFGMGGKITSVRTEAEMEDPSSGETVKVDVLTKISSGAKFGGVKIKDAIDLEELTQDYEEMQTVMEEVSSNLMKIVKENKSLVKDLDDTLGMDVDDIEDALLSGFGF